ncbi:MAG: hypothetical protein E6J41_08195 [Chloroflexi bacterium]|nr:MAG: hypothetical protein E6J41_08195 [Chloroflexota bacterium]
MTRIDPELAALVRERLDAREPRLPARFIPRSDRQPRRLRMAAAVVVAFLLGVGVALLLQPSVGSTVLSGVLGRPSVVTPAPTAPPSGTPGAVPGAGPAGRPLPSGSGSPSPSPTPNAGGQPAAPPAAPGGAPTPAPTQSGGGITIQVSVPPVLPPPPPPAPTPTPSPTPTCLLPLPLICVRT